MRNPSSSTTTKPTPCCVKLGLKKGPWTPEEDEKLGKFIKKEGEGGWRTLPKRAGLLRCGKSCRLRWMNYLRPNVKRGQIAPDEEDLILRLHRLLGNRWSLIAGRIPGRTDNEIKNYWNTHLSKKLINQGIDPRTHKPLVLFNTLTNNNNSSSEDPKPPSSKPNNIPISPSYNPNPSPNPNHSFGLEEIINGNKFLYGNQENNNLLDHQDYQAQTNGIIGNGNEDNMNYCNTTDDVFTSFLNSFINEDVFLSQHQQLHQVNQQPINGNIEAPFGSSHALMSYTEAFGLNNANWESALMSGFNLKNNDPTRFNEDNHVE